MVELVPASVVGFEGAKENPVVGFEGAPNVDVMLGADDEGGALNAEKGVDEFCVGAVGLTSADAVGSDGAAKVSPKPVELFPKPEKPLGVVGAVADEVCPPKEPNIGFEGVEAAGAACGLLLPSPKPPKPNFDDWSSLDSGSSSSASISPRPGAAAAGVGLNSSSSSSSFTALRRPLRPGVLEEPPNGLVGVELPNGDCALVPKEEGDEEVPPNVLEVNGEDPDVGRELPNIPAPPEDGEKEPKPPDVVFD